MGGITDTRKVLVRHWRRGSARSGCSNCSDTYCGSRGKSRRPGRPASRRTSGQTSGSAWTYWVACCRHDGYCAQCTAEFGLFGLTFARRRHWTPLCVWTLGSPQISSQFGTPSGELPARLGTAGPALTPLQQHPVCEGGTGGRPRTWGSPGGGSVGTKSQKSPTSETLLAVKTIFVSHDSAEINKWQGRRN